MVAPSRSRQAEDQPTRSDGQGQDDGRPGDEVSNAVSSEFELQRDQYLLNRMRINSAKLKPDEVKEAAELVRGVMALRAAAVEALKTFREEKGV